MKNLASHQCNHIEFVTCLITYKLIYLAKSDLRANALKAPTKNDPAQGFSTIFPIVWNRKPAIQGPQNIPAVTTMYHVDIMNKLL